MIRSYATILLMILLGGCAGGSLATRGAAGTAAQPDKAAMLEVADATRADGRFAEAAQIYEQILIAEPGSAAAQYGMAESLLGLGRTKEARPLFAGLAKQKEFRAIALQGTGITDLAERKYEDSARTLKEALEADPGLWRAYNGLGLIADMRRQPDEAESFYGKALEIEPDSAVVLNNRGYSRLAAGKAEAAIADFRRALALDPGSDTVQNNLRLAMATKGNYEEATRSLTQRQQAVVLNNVGVIAMQRGDLIAAEGLLARAMAASSRYDAVTARNLQQVTSLKADSK